jgi:CheY-like chemotaxis protein
MKSKGTLLLIENEPSDIHLFKQAIQEIGFKTKVDIVDSARAAMEYIEKTGEKTFLILCDMNMPKMSGIELKREIEKTAKMHRKSIPFVFFSTNENEEILEEAYDLGAQGYFLKGDNYQQYIERLTTIIKYWDLCHHPQNTKDY